MILFRSKPYPMPFADQITACCRDKKDKRRWIKKGKNITQG